MPVQAACCQPAPGHAHVSVVLSFSSRAICTSCQQRMLATWGAELQQASHIKGRLGEVGSPALAVQDVLQLSPALPVGGQHHPAVALGPAQAGQPTEIAAARTRLAAPPAVGVVDLQTQELCQGIRPPRGLGHHWPSELAAMQLACLPELRALQGLDHGWPSELAAMQLACLPAPRGWGH